MYTYKVVIVDDDEIAADNLALELKAKPEFSVEGVARNARLAKRLIDKVHPELLFLDVEMPDMTGMELLQDIRDSIVWNMRVVFYTAYDKYMIQAIRESAFDYLLKPFQHQDLEDILKRFLQQMQMGQRTISTPVTPSVSETFMVYTPTNDMRVLRTGEIGFFRYSSERKLWEVILNNEPPLTLRRGMTAEQIVHSLPRFLQIHQSYIINIDYLMLIKDNHCLLYPPFDRVTELQVSKKYKKELQERFCL